MSSGEGISWLPHATNWREIGQDPFEGLPHQDPRKHIEELEDLVSRSGQNEVSEYHMLCKIFPYSISGMHSDATREKEKNDRWDRFLASLDDEYMIPVQLLNDFIAKKDEQHVSGELSRVEEAGTEDTTSKSIDITTSTSIDSTTTTSTDDKTSTSIDGSPQKSTDISSCDLVPDLDRESTMEDFLELEDEEQPENLDHNLEKKLDDCQHTSEKDLETSKASIDRYQPDEIDRQPPHIIDRHRQPLIDQHHPPNIDRCSLLYVPPEEATEFHKRVKRIHDPVKIVVPCVVVEVESPIPPDRSMQLSPYVGVLDDPLHAEASQRGLLFRDEVDKGPSEAASIDTDRMPSINTNNLASIDTTTSPSIDTTPSPSIDIGRISEQKEFDVCGNLRDVDTTTRSDKSGGKKRRNWKKRKRIMGNP
ncbi:hypothetical protein F2Q68_00034604 [Brassica cretica]|uniref:Uncharacterized protein n=1 Tax=Brassica cretica TaxID=69181 RepID=A0A8S9H1P1_BRACR|nr:hypothetical protein F2Q68_00034604 [Brassica cretica]